jgi:large repetitive protein
LLSEGANTVRVVAKNGAGTAEASSGVRYIAPQAPKVSILEPRNQAQTTVPGATLKAKVEFVSAASQIQVTHNKRAIRDFSLDKGGNLSASITLAEGINTLTVEANTPEGRDQASVSVTYKAPPPPPVASKPQVTITTPKRSGVTVKAADYTVTADLRHVDNKSQIKVLINGRAFTDFRFSAGTGILSIPFTLREGANSVVVEATTRAGTASARTEINYVKEVVSVPKPEIKIESASQPAVSPFNPNEASSQVLATTKQVSQRSQVTFLVNDVPLTNFDFDAATGKLSGIIRLKKGANKVEIKVQTDQGSASDTITVQFN